MGFRNLQETVASLEQAGQLCRIEVEIDPYLEAGAIQRRVYAKGGPALLFSKVKGCPFPMLANLFGTLPFISKPSIFLGRKAIEMRLVFHELLGKGNSFASTRPMTGAKQMTFLSNIVVISN